MPEPPYLHGPPPAAELFPVTHSVLSAEALGRYIERAYAIGEVGVCALLQHNLNDTYLVEAASGPYILRVSQAQRPNGLSWRSSEDVLFELDVLRHLARKSIPVATPLTNRDGTDVLRVQAPEGVRHLVLFTYAPGEPVSAPKQTEPLARRYGQAVGALHNATDDFESLHDRFALDVDFLLETPLTTLQPLLRHRPADWTYLRALGVGLAERLLRLQDRGLDTGVCHGDAQGGNACMATDGTLTFFDFDVCGKGWRAYDIAVFFWGAELGRVRLGWDKRTSDQLCAAYINGYQERRALRPVDHEAIAPLVHLRHYWYLGLEAANWDTWGISGAGRDAFFDRELAFMRQWSTDHPIGQ